MSGPDELRAQAGRLRELHRGDRILVLPNAWDVASARIFAASPGCRALGTTSAGVAAVLGYPDGERIPADEMLEAVGRIARAVSVPVSADLEAGYGSGADEVAATAEGALAVGAVGMNLEDGTGSEDAPLYALEDQVAKVAAVRDVAERVGVPLVLNARTDVFLAGVGAPEDRLEHAVERANAYLAAGADCAFVPGVADGELIGRLVEAIGGPVNVLAVAGTPPVRELERLGVARVSVGSGPMRAALALTEEVARALLEEGTFTAFTDRALAYERVNRLLADV